MIRVLIIDDEPPARAKVRRLLVEVLRDKDRWHTFATKIKLENVKRPAFQEEFAKVVPGWRELKQDRQRRSA